MAQYIKKVGVTPTRGNGFILDSFSTNDNKEFNAPSLNAVEKRDDNNLLFCGWLGVESRRKLQGWTFYKDSGEGNVYYDPGYGIVFDADTVGRLYTPYYFPIDDESGDILNTYRVSITICYTTTSTGWKTAICENVVASDDGRVVVDDEGFKITIGKVVYEGGTKFNIENNTDKNIWIIGVKIENGAKASEFIRYGKDYSISSILSYCKRIDYDNLLPNHTYLNTLHYNSEDSGKWYFMNARRLYYHDLPEDYDPDENGFLQLFGSNQDDYHNTWYNIHYGQILIPVSGKAYYQRTGYYDYTNSVYVWNSWEKFTSDARRKVYMGTFTTNANGEASITYALPTGFTADNCVVVAIGISDHEGKYRYYKLGSDTTCTREYAVVSGNSITIYFQGTSEDGSTQLKYRCIVERVDM